MNLYIQQMRISYEECDKRQRPRFDRLRPRLRLSAGDNSADKIVASGGMLCIADQTPSGTHDSVCS